MRDKNEFEKAWEQVKKQSEVRLLQTQVSFLILAIENIKVYLQDDDVEGALEYIEQLDKDGESLDPVKEESR